MFEDAIKGTVRKTEGNWLPASTIRKHALRFVFKIAYHEKSMVIKTTGDDIVVTAIPERRTRGCCICYNPKDYASPPPPSPDSILIRNRVKKN